MYITASAVTETTVTVASVHRDRAAAIATGRACFGLSALPGWAVPVRPVQGDTLVRLGRTEVVPRMR